MKTSRQEKIDELISIGTWMSNACFNLKQKDSLEKHDKKSLEDVQKSWDKKYKEVPKKLDLSDRKNITHIMKIIQKEVGFFNGWKVDEETESDACMKAAAKIAKYLKSRV